MFHTILFDLDGTLTDPKLGITSSVQYALKAFGIEEPNLDKLESFIGPPLQDSFQEFYGFDAEQTNKAIEKYRERFQDKGIYENEIYPGIAAMLESLCASGRRLAVASSKPTPMVERVLDYFHIRQYFVCIVGSHLDGTRGKKEEVVEEALRQLFPEGIPDSVQKDSVAMVGDRRFDIEGAKAHGLTAVGVSFGYAPEGELCKAGADYIVDSVEQLAGLLLQS